MNKRIAVLNHLKDNGSITSMEAIENYGATRLSAIIFNLRKAGHNIETVSMGMTDRYGHQVNYAKYVLHDNQDDTLDLGV